MRNSTTDRSPPVVMGPVHSCHDMFALDAALPHAWARDPSRQLVFAECRCKLFLPILCGVACAAQAVLQQPAHEFVTCLVIFWRQVEEHSSSCWSAQVRQQVPHNFSSTFTRGDLRQHIFQRLQRRRRRLQLPCVRLVFLRDPPPAHVGLPWLSLVSLRPSCLDGCLLRLTWARLSRDTRVHLVATHALHLFTSSHGAHPRVKPQAEQFLLVVMHEFLHFILDVTCSIVLDISWTIPRILFASFAFFCSCVFNFGWSSLNCSSIVRST